jgi:hypothetical protein
MLDRGDARAAAGQLSAVIGARADNPDRESILSD